MLHTYLGILETFYALYVSKGLELFEHCETKGHQRKLDANKAPFDVQSERRQFVETERCTYSQVIIGFIEENFTEKEFYTNFDHPDGITDRLDLFPESPKRVTMNTPELDSAPQDMVVCDGMLPMEFPHMPTSLVQLIPVLFLPPWLKSHHKGAAQMLLYPREA